MPVPAADTSILERFTAATRSWFGRAFAGPTEVQARGWRTISSGEHALLLAPTGSGKTLAAFLWAIDRLAAEPRAEDEAPGVRVLYVSPLKALVYDVERNLRAPLAGVVQSARGLGQPVPEVRVSVRTGDTPQRDRARFKRKPGDVLVTTPESLYLLLTSQSREALRTVHTVIIDEIHAVAGTKRGAHLALTLERLSSICHQDPQRVGLSATQRPLERIAGFLGGDRPVSIVDASAPPEFDLEIIVPMDDMDNPPAPEPELEPGVGEDDFLSTGVHPVSTPGMDRAGVWPSIQARILDLVVAHRSTILFTNSRRLCERLSQRLNELAATRGLSKAVCRAHHGSISHRQRTEIEEALKTGTLPCIVATSSLELGIDMGAVDLVIQVAAPPSVASGLQRIGRAGHAVGAISKGRLFPKFKGDLLASAVVARGMRAGLIEETRPPINPLDVLAQQIAAMCVVEERPFDALLALVRRAAPFRELSVDAFVAVLEMLSGHLPTLADNNVAIVDPEAAKGFEQLRPLLAWDRTANVLRARRGARLTVVANAGTIPDRGSYGVFIAPDGPRVGELDEEMVYESRKGDVFLLGASSWRIVEITRDRVLVVPAPGEPGRMPFWRGEGPGRPVELGRAMGALVREVGESDDPEAVLRNTCGLDHQAATNLATYIADQRSATEVLPTDRTLVVERFRDEFGDWRVCLHSPFGGRLHAPWSLAVSALLEARTGVDTQCIWSDDGIVIRLDGTVDELPPLDVLLPDPADVEELVIGRLESSAMFAARFREAAGRSLLLPRSRPGKRTPLWLQRMRAQSLLAAAARFPSFPVTLEAYRECLRDVFDLSGLVEVLTDIHARRIRVAEVETDAPSPFARSLVFAFVANWLYEGDAPLAERRAAALSIDRALLRELLGEDELRDLIDPAAYDEVEAELQRLIPERACRHADHVEEMLRKLGCLSTAEVRARTVEGAEVEAWLAQLQSEGRAVTVRVAGEPRWIVPADVARYRDALGVVPPAGLPTALLERVPRPLETLLARYGRTHASFSAGEAAARFGLAPGAVEPALARLAEEGVLVVDPRGEGTWCDREVLRRLKRRTLARLRGEVEPVDTAALAAFLPAWHGVAAHRGERGRGGLGRLVEVLTQLEGCPLPWSEVEARILPARVPGYHAQMLDGLFASGEFTWVGAGPIGARDGRVLLLRRENLGVLCGAGDTSVLEREDGLHQAVLDALEQRGASFSVELHRSLRDHADAATLDAVIWDLAWAGLVSNDTLEPLRGLSRKRRRGRGRRGRTQWRRPGWGRAGRSSVPPSSPKASASGPGTLGGRWWSTRSWTDDAASPTEQLHATAVVLLERYGVVGRELALQEGVSGGFAGLYPVLRDMEDMGQVRRGWFVAGLSGAQFALPGAVDRLRAAREAEGVWVLAATDPANPYGAVTRWPELEHTQLRREAGATVVLVDGALGVVVPRGGAHLVVFFDGAEGTDSEGTVARALDALRHTWTLQRRKSPRFVRINGLDAAESPVRSRLVALGLVADPTGLTLELAP